MIRRDETETVAETCGHRALKVSGRCRQIGVGKIHETRKREKTGNTEEKGSHVDDELGAFV